MPNQEERKRGKSIALKFLSYRDRSLQEIALYLDKKGFSKNCAQQTVDELKELGYLNDERFARTWGHSRIESKNIGKFRLHRELRNKGIATETIDRVLESLYAERSEYQVAAECAEKKFATLKGVGEEKKKRRLIQFLQRRGFSSDVIFKLVQRLMPKLPDAQDDDAASARHGYVSYDLD